MPLLAVCCDSEQPDAVRRAEALSRLLNAPHVHSLSSDYPLLLTVTTDRLELRQTDSTAGPVYADFSRARFGARAAPSLRRELLARAVGFKGAPLEIIDATAGLGRDAVVLALLGCRVTAIESNPVVHALLEDGLRRASQTREAAAALTQRLRLVPGDAVAYLAALPLSAPPDVVYLDPMFPPRTGTARSKKEMQVFTRLLDSAASADGPSDAGAVRLLHAATATGCHRVVVKRPLHAAPLAGADGRPPALRFAGRAVRFDVYFAPGHPVP